MSEEIIQRLGFNVSDALTALQNVDKALVNTSQQFGNFGAALSKWNSQAAPALKTLRALASAAGRASGALKGASALNTPAPAAPAAPAAAATSKLWLPQGYASGTQAATASMQAAANAATKAGQAGNKAATSWSGVGKSARGAKSDTDKFIVSLNTLNRVVQTQLIVRVMSAVRDEIKAAVRESIRFQQQIAEIRTIAPAIGGDFKSLSSEVAQLSKTFNISLSQAGSGLYQTLSNQFATLAERTDIMRASAVLARTAVMDFGAATSLLTGTLNAYGMASSQAMSAASKFFTTIQLGRVTGSELANSIGTVIPMAASLGVTLDELNASIVAMTIGGIDARKTMTGLRSAMTALQKPSEDMKDVVRNLGFTSPEQLVAAKGWQGALEAIAESSGNLGSEVVKSFRNIRAFTAGLRLTGDGAEKAAEALEAMKDATPEKLGEIFAEFKSTDAEKFTAAINEMKVTLTQDLGAVLVRTLAMFVQLVGGADNLSAAIQGVAAAAIPATGAIMAAAAAFVVLNSAMGPIGLALMAVTAAISASFGWIVYDSAKAVNAVRKVANEAREASRVRLELIEEERRQANESLAGQERAAQQAWENSAAALRRDYFKAIDELKIKNRELIATTRTTMQSIISAQGKVVSAYKNTANEAVRATNEARQRQITTEQKYADSVFKFNLKNKNSWQIAEETMRRGRTLAGQAASALAKAKTPDETQAALGIYQRAEAYSQEAVSIAAATGNINLQHRAQNAVLGVLRQRITAEQSLQRASAQQAQAAAKQAASETRRLNRMKVLQKEILSDLEAFSKGEARDPKALKAQEDRLRKNVSEFRDLWQASKAPDVGDILQIDQLQQRIDNAIEGGVSQMEVESLYSTPDTFADYREEIERGIGSVRVMVDFVTRSAPGFAEMTQGMGMEQRLSALSQRYSDNLQVIEDYRGQEMAVDNFIDRAQASTENAQKNIRVWLNEFALTEFNRLDEAMSKFFTPKRHAGWQKAIDDFAHAAAKFVGPKKDIDLDSYNELNTAYEQYLEVMKPGQASKEALAQFMKDAQSAADSVEQARAVGSGMAAMAERYATAEREIPIIKQALDEARIKAIEMQDETIRAQKRSEEVLTSQGDLSQVDLSPWTTQLRTAAGYMRSIALSSAKVKPLPASVAGKEGPRALGGEIRYLANGGNVGTDVIHTALAKEEFVVKAASARKFASQLVAMNAGVRPVFRSEGGSVTNIGDINVSVTGGSTGRQTARSIASELRREFRRGTSTI